MGLCLGVLLDRQILVTLKMTDMAVPSLHCATHQHMEFIHERLDPTRPIQSCPACPTCTNKTTTTDRGDSPLEPPRTQKPTLQSPRHHSPTESHQKETATQSFTSTKRWQQSQLFPDDSIRHLVAGMGRVSRDEFAQTFDMGYALDPTTPATQHVLILYGSDRSLPKSFHESWAPPEESVQRDDVAAADSHRSIAPPWSPILGVDEALQNCQSVKLVLTQPSKKIYRRKKKLRHDAECLAVMSQWESQHLHTFQRQKVRRDLDSTYNESSQYEQIDAANSNGWKYSPARENVLESIRPEHVEASQRELTTYLSAIPDALQRLGPLLRQATAPHGRNNHGNHTSFDNTRQPVIVMVCNYGQANLLTNFVCSARARNLDLSRLVIFATDHATEQLARMMGLLVFADETIFASIPMHAAHNYSDHTFGLVMMAKVYCVHLTLMLGYDVLFQDVDVVWYQSPLEFFQNYTINAGFDVYFQHDGYHHPERFKPLAANSGLYYVRHNARTVHLFQTLARSGELILATKSHQAALTIVIAEHMNAYGLRVKVLGDLEDLFPNGYALQKGAKVTKYMREQNATKPILFHANWLEKKIKRPALEGTMNWFVRPVCYDAATDELAKDLPENVLASCCLVTPCCSMDANG